ncbi:MAG: UDP-N-acetylmuramate dehydrogenase [Eggerthellaceae bacterium]|nr:UDP-N-acetylmuramate dehydrogenase [Eggerthellaceae bacterium]
MDQLVAQKLEGVVGADNVALDEPMSRHTTFRVGGPADAFVTPGSVEELQAVLDACRTAGERVYVLGCGSNVLVSDEGLRGVVVRIGPKMADVDIRPDGSVVAQAGAMNSKIARAAQAAGLAGFEFAAGIPGTIGGAAIMNAGAYGGELRDVATGVTCLAEGGDLVELTAEQADWSYRHSMMGDAGYIVLSVALQLHADDPAAIQERMDDLSRRRNEKQPLDLPSAGSTFKRPEGHFAGKLIQDAGMQGHTVGGVQVSTKHAGFVVNIGDATAADVLQVIQDVREAVMRQAGVELEPEVRLWGFGSE